MVFRSCHGICVAFFFSFESVFQLCSFLFFFSYFRKPFLLVKHCISSNFIIYKKSGAIFNDAKFMLNTIDFNLYSVLTATNNLRFVRTVVNSEVKITF